MSRKGSCVLAILALSVMVLASNCGGDSTTQSNDDVTQQDVEGAQDVQENEDLSSREDSLVEKDLPEGEDQTSEDQAVEDSTVEDVATQDTTQTTEPGFIAPDPATTFTYRLYSFEWGELGSYDVPGKFGVREEKFGHEYRRVELGDFTQDQVHGLIIWANHTEEGMETGGVEVYQGAHADEPSFAYFFEEPLSGSFLVEPGTATQTSTTGHFVMDEQEMPFEITLDYELVSLNETVEVPAGIIDGCIHYRFVENSTDLSDFGVDYWVKDHIGIVKATTVPGFEALELVDYVLP